MVSSGQRPLCEGIERPRGRPTHLKLCPYGNKHSDLSYLLSIFFDALEMVIQLPVQVGEVDDGAGVSALEVLGNILSETLCPLSLDVELSERVHQLFLLLQALAQSDDQVQELDGVAAQVAVEMNNLRYFFLSKRENGRWPEFGLTLPLGVLPLNRGSLTSCGE